MCLSSILSSFVFCFVLFFVVWFCILFLLFFWSVLENGTRTEHTPSNFRHISNEEETDKSCFFSRKLLTYVNIILETPLRESEIEIKTAEAFPTGCVDFFTSIDWTMELLLDIAADEQTFLYKTELNVRSFVCLFVGRCVIWFHFN